MSIYVLVDMSWVFWSGYVFRRFYSSQDSMNSSKILIAIMTRFWEQVQEYVVSAFAKNQIKGETGYYVVIHRVASLFREICFAMSRIIYCKNININVKVKLTVILGDWTTVRDKQIKPTWPPKIYHFLRLFCWTWIFPHKENQQHYRINGELKPSITSF